MKIRADFVTNSSSSSFILGFKNKNKIATDLVKCFDENTMELFPVVFIDAINEEHRISENDILEQINEYYKWELDYKLYSQYRSNCRAMGTECLQRSQWAELTETKKMMNEKMQEIIEKAKKKMQGKTYFVEVEYSDHEYPELEHDILYKSKNLIIDFNNH